MASHESFCKNLVDYFRQAALGIEKSLFPLVSCVTESPNYL
ncbi:hypothetical protein WH8501_13130 [Crocosphaera watsonii WH 8501]